ncbi:MAG: 16S rRNA (adenine(1518)-N(6)/adenine(1519)-N(6))-dimethyltransferase [Flavobacteriales bacterium]|nr:MAG: 16S rRNA (adenine(1518)-N(6)/adenine(1519)-N(6))-dimethyltransferase [Flavobacteriales bacterium]
MSVRPKKHLGQHFLKDENTAKKITDSLTEKGYETVLEIGPGTGVLTKYLLQKKYELFLIEIDRESVIYLEKNYPELRDKIISENFLKFNLKTFFNHRPIAIIGNFPYNISSQIIFKTIEHKEQIAELCGMFQKEVALRITSASGSKTYGILSVLTQAFYKTEYLFTVPPTVFYPPPKVESGVIRLRRKEDYTFTVSEKLFTRVVKTAFNQRRKTLRNSLKSFNLPLEIKEDAIFAKRPEQLSLADFVSLTEKIASYGI